MAEIYKVHEGECAGDVPEMIRVIRICRNCGAKIFSDAPEGLCTGCVLETALGNSPHAAVVGGDSSAVALAKADDSRRVDELSRDETSAELLGELGDYELLEE